MNAHYGAYRALWRLQSISIYQVVGFSGHLAPLQVRRKLNLKPVMMESAREILHLLEGRDDDVIARPDHGGGRLHEDDRVLHLLPVDAGLLGVQPVLEKEAAHAP